MTQGHGPKKLFTRESGQIKAVREDAFNLLEEVKAIVEKAESTRPPPPVKGLKPVYIPPRPRDKRRDSTPE